MISNSKEYKKLKKKGTAICPTCKAKVTTLPCVICRTKELDVISIRNNDWLKLDRLLGTEGEKFVRIVKDIINIDKMRAIHHPLFASLVKQSRDALKVLPNSLKERQ